MSTKQASTSCSFYLTCAQQTAMHRISVSLHTLQHAVGFAIAFCLMLSTTLTASAEQTDVLIYGATPAGIAAAISAAKDGCSVTLVEPTSRIGGLVTNGLSHTDFHSRESLSGSFLDFSRRVETYYRETYGPNSPQVEHCEQGVFGEPKVNLLVFERMLSEFPRIRIVKNLRLYGVRMQRLAKPSERIVDHVEFTSPDGSKLKVNARVVIDASYEGDIVEFAGLPWRVGREGRNEFGESLAPETADKQLQAYNFRFIMTDKAENRVLPQAPAGYRREDFLDILPILESGEIERVFGYPSKCIFKAHLPALPNDKYDINDVSRSIVRLSLPGKNLKWPAFSQEDRDAIFQEHLRDQVGLLYFLQNDPAVPKKFQDEARQWGWCRDEFVETGGIPQQLYVREARRLSGLHVYSQADSEHAPNDARAKLHMDSIAMGDYGNNCHGTDHEGPRFGGKHTGEFYNAVPPYQIPYFVLVPHDVENLLIPTAVSSTHVGFCALRLEPIWMSLGEAAGHAAALAKERDCPVQKIPVRQLQSRLHRNGSATIYVSDCLPGHADFEAVQWWGLQGGLHGLHPMPDKPGQRGKQKHGQYFEANPGHTVDLDQLLDAKLKERWLNICILAGLKKADLVAMDSANTRGDFIRAAFAAANRLGLLTSSSNPPRLHPKALSNTHAPGEVDNAELIPFVVSDPASIAGIVVDDVDAQLTGDWTYSTHTPPYVGRGYLHDNYKDKGRKSARFVPNFPQAGLYEVRIAHCSNVRRTDRAPVTIKHADGKTRLTVDQQKEAEHNHLFKSLGVFRFEQGSSGYVEISTDGTDGKVVIADAIQFLSQ